MDDVEKLGIVASGSDTPRTLSSRFGDSLSVEDFGKIGISPEQDKTVLEKADKSLLAQGRKVLHVTAGQVLHAGPSFALEKADHTILVGEGQLVGAVRKAVHPEYLSAPQMFPPTVRSAQHLQQFHRACQQGKATIVVMGDSIFATASDMVAHTENACFAWIETLQQHNPNVAFQFVNAAVGGRNWSDMNSDSCLPPPWIDPKPGISWKEAVADLQPDILLLNSAGNDVGCFHPKAVEDTINYFQSLDNPPSIILGISHLPSLSSDLNGYGTEAYLQGFDTVAKWLRTYAIRNGIGYLDFCRWHTIRRDGFDPCELVLSRVYPDEDTDFSKFGVSQGVSHLGKWKFPNAKNQEDIPANCITDFVVSFELQERPLFLSVDLSGQKVDGNRIKYANRLYVFFNEEDGNISWSWSNGNTDDCLLKKKTNVPIPYFPAKFNVMVKGSRVVFSTWIQFQNSDWQPGELASLGTGYQYICDETLIRFGGEFCPCIYWAGASEILIHNLCVGSSVRTSGGGVRNMPDCTNSELFVHTNKAGGSNSYHMNAYGVRDILVPVIRTQDWSPSLLIQEEINNEISKIKKEYDFKIEKMMKVIRNYIVLGDKHV